MIPADIICKKRDGIELNTNEINKFIEGYLLGSVTESQMSAFLMSIYFNGLTKNETLVMLEKMINSGSKLNFRNSKRYTADKHSTGGIGDKISIILSPLMAASGINIPMIAGKGLGFTGGTIDKIDSIPGIDTTPSLKIFEDWVNRIGVGIISQSKEICPADHKIYSLRNETGTIPSLPLICCSILSKKIAEGIQGLVLDIKVGSGAFMKTKNKAIELSQLMIDIGTSYGIKIDTVFTNMDQPLGKFAGLACEINESIECLKGEGSDDLMKVTYELGSKLLLQANLARNKKNAIKTLKKLIQSKTALKYFYSMIENQKGNIKKFQSNTEPKYEEYIYATESGIIRVLDTEKIGWALVELGCGYKNPNDLLDYTAGVEFLKKIGDKVTLNEPIYRVFNSDLKKLKKCLRLLMNTFTIDICSEKFKLIL